MLDEVAMAREKPKNEEILAGQNVTGNGENILFRTAPNVRTASTMIPPRVTFTASSAEELIEVLKREDAMRAFRFHPATVASEVKLENDPYETASSSQAVKPESVTPTSVPESLCYSTDDTPKKDKPMTPRTSPAGSDTIVRPSKRPREGDADEEDEMDTTSAVSDDEEYRDFSDPEVCIDLFHRMRGTSLKVNYETQVSLKKLNTIHFNERARLLKKKQPLRRKIDDKISKMKLQKLVNPPKKLKKETSTSKEESSNEKLLETPKKEEKDEFHDFLDTFEKDTDPNATATLPRGVDHDGVKFTAVFLKLDEGPYTPLERRMMEKADDLDYTPKVEFEDNAGSTNHGKLHYVADCLLVFLITRGLRAQGQRSIRPVRLTTVTYDLTGELEKKFTIELVLINFTYIPNHYLSRNNSTLILAHLHGNGLGKTWIQPTPNFYG